MHLRSHPSFQHEAAARGVAAEPSVLLPVFQVCACGVARAWRVHGMCVACAWRVYGVPWTWYECATGHHRNAPLTTG